MEPMTIPAMAPPERVVDEVVLVLSAVVARVIVAVAAVMVVVAWRMARAGVGVSGRAGMVETGLGLLDGRADGTEGSATLWVYRESRFQRPFLLRRGWTCGEGTEMARETALEEREVI